MKLNDKQIAALEGKGFKRWTKGSMDRLYIDATEMGLELTYYKTGNVSSATWQGEQISNSQGRAYKYAKTYIDVTTGEVISTNDTLREAAEAILSEVERENAEEAVEVATAQEGTEKIDDVKSRVIDLAASYFANWRAAMAAHEADDERDYRCKYEGAQLTAALLGIEEREIEEHAWKKWGDEIGRVYAEENQ